MSTRSSTPNPAFYIVVLDVATDVVRALLFDSEARRMEGYAAQLPRRADAAADCLDELHRLVHADGLPIAAVVGRAESELTAEDRSYWPAFSKARWFPPLPEGAGVVLGSGCLDRQQVALVVGPASMLATVADRPHESLTSIPIDDTRWLIYQSVPEAGGVYASIRRDLHLKTSVEQYLETAAPGDAYLARLDGVAEQFRDALAALSPSDFVSGRFSSDRMLTHGGSTEPRPSGSGQARRGPGGSSQVIGCGAPLLKSPAWSQRIANTLGTPLTLCSEPEPGLRGAALWALEQIGAIPNMDALPASIATVFTPSKNKNMNAELFERASRIRMLLMDVDGVLTDAKLYNVPGPDGKMFETKAFDAQDGIALQWLSWYGIETGVISGRVSPATEERARQVKMKHVYQGHIEKIPILQEICEKSGIPSDAIAYIGDDLTDVVVMRRVALGFAPANARAEVKKAAHMVTTAAGGAGAVREVCEVLLKAQGKWPEILKKYEIE